MSILLGCKECGRFLFNILVLVYNSLTVLPYIYFINIYLPSKQLSFVSPSVKKRVNIGTMLCKLIREIFFFSERMFVSVVEEVQF